MCKNFATCWKHVFWPKNCIFYPNLRTLNMYALASSGFGFRRSKVTRNDKKILCIRQNYVLVEFFQTISPGIRIFWRGKISKLPSFNLCNVHFFCGQDNLLAEQFWAMGRLKHLFTCFTSLPTGCPRMFYTQKCKNLRIFYCNKDNRIWYFGLFRW